MIVLTISCQKPMAPDFKSIENVKVSLNGFTSADLNCNANFYNPNSNKIILKKVNIDVNVDGKYLTNISEEFDLEIAPETDFTVPVDVNIPFKNINIQDALALMKNTVGEKAFHFEGNIKVKMYGLNFNIPIDHMENIEFD